MDFIRIIAIWMVIFNHTEKLGYMVFAEKQDSPYFWIYLGFSIFITVAVPLFWMISGSLLLPKEEKVKDILYKRVLRFFIVLVLFSLLQYVYKYKNGRVEVYSVKDFISRLFSDNMAYAYWYLYAYLGYLLSLPFIRKIAKGLQKAEYYYLFIASMLYSACIPMIEFFYFKNEVSLNGNFSICIISSQFIVYPLLGYYMEHIKKEEEYTLKEFLFCLFVSIGIILFAAVLTKYKCTYEDIWRESHAQTFFRIFQPIVAYTVFYGVKLWSLHHTVKDAVQKILQYFGAGTFGLMLIENIVREKTLNIYDFLCVKEFNYFIAAIIWVSVVTVIGLLITSFFKKIPVFRKLI